MTLITTINDRGTELKIDLDELRRYGQYFIDDERNLIIRAVVYTHGTKDSRFVTEIDVGTDYVFRPIDVDISEIQRSLEQDLNITVTDERAENIATYYQRGGIEVITDWADDLQGDWILTKARNTIISTDVEEPLLGWEHEFEELVDRAEETTTLNRREITWELLNAAQNASPGDYEYSARIELTNPTP